MRAKIINDCVCSKIIGAKKYSDETEHKFHPLHITVRPVINAPHPYLLVKIFI
jgi:hypothetical protein